MGDIPDKNSVILVSTSFYNQYKSGSLDESAKLSLIVREISSNLDNMRSTYDISENECSFDCSQFCRDTLEFTSFYIRVYHSFMKKKPDEKRHVIVAHRLRGDSLQYFKIFNQIKAAFTMKDEEPCIVNSSLNPRKKVFLQRQGNRLSEEEFVREKVRNWGYLLEKNDYLDQKTFAVRALAMLARSSVAARKAICENRNLIDRLRFLFDKTDDLFCQPNNISYPECDLQLYTTCIFAALSEDPQAIHFLMGSGIFKQCFKSILFLSQFESNQVCASSKRGEVDDSVRNHKINHHYKHSKRETARCLANISAVASLQALTALQSEGLDFCTLSHDGLSDDEIRGYTERFLSCMRAFDR